jgi:C4-dicarboxylate-specific signal transduction histidine kinase
MNTNASSARRTASITHEIKQPMAVARMNAAAALRFLGSGLIDQSQKMTVAAMQMADMKVWAQRS